VNTLTSPFCEHCGATNEPEATCCPFCASPLQTASCETDSGNLPADALLRRRYRIIKAVGQGGMGTVYRAQDTELNDRFVAVKEMSAQGLSAQHIQEATEAFKREATLLAALQHPNLPSVFEHFEEHGRWYMVMSFIQGETLEDYLKRPNCNKLPLNEVLRIGEQLCTALYYLHSQYPPIIFRDVKPANIMRAPDGQIYLIDFGVARRFKPGQKKDTTPFGSIGYAPPEQFNKAQTTPRSDIYSLGATFYQLLTGHEPDSTPFRFPQLQSLEPEVPTQLATLLEQMLDMDEGKRPVNMLVVKRKLEEMSTAHAHLLSSVSFTLPKTAKQKRQHILRVAIMFVLAISCIVGGGFIGNGFDLSNANIPFFANVNATATAVQVSALADPYSPKGTLALVDPLDQASAWPEQSNVWYADACHYKNNVYQVKTGGFSECDENNSYTNFAVEVRMTILQGDCGGIVVRSDGENLYYFSVCSNGTYAFDVFTPPSNSNTLTVHNTNPVIKQKGQANIIAVVANGSTFDLYINYHKIERVSDNSFHSGMIGLAAYSNTPAIVSYQDAIIWTLS
jgi:serine/threonine protein kinase